MRSVIHRAETRGNADHGWLNSYHTFSFANYYDPTRMNFGMLRALNDDTVSAGQGFGKHPHDNMEIISIPLSGDLKHEDSMGNQAVIQEGEIQVMSAGTGIFHSEYNANNHQPVQFLQIWVHPNKSNVAPRYSQVPMKALAIRNKLYQVLSPDANDAGVWIYQDAWFYMGDFDAGQSDTYKLHRPGNGVYTFVLEGTVTANGQQLNRRDGYGIWEAETLSLQATTNARVLLMEVPMND